MRLRNDWDIRAAVIGWLRYQRRCNLVCYERSPVHTVCRPDIIGVDHRRRVIEVEQKISMSDFRANAKKRGMGDNGPLYYTPHQFYFVVPQAIVEAVEAELPSWAGLMTLAPRCTQFGPQVMCVRGAPINKSPTILTIRQMVEMVAHQTGSMHRAAVALAQAAKEKP